MNWNKIESVLVIHAFKVMVFILILHAVVQVLQIYRDDITADEEDHLIYGVEIWKGNASRRVEGRDFRSTMPITALHALPRAIEQVLQPDKKKTDWGKGDIKTGRYITLGFTLGLLVYIFLFSQSLFGPVAGLFCLVMAAADPNILAHGHLLTTDMAATFFCVASLYHLFQWLQQGQGRQFVLFSIIIALAQIAKINNLLLYPICLLILLLAGLQQQKFDGRRMLSYLFFFLLTQLLVINLAFQFNHTWFHADRAVFSSSFMNNLVNRIGLSVPIPLPLPYIDTFDQINYEIEHRDGLPLNYLMGERSNGGFWNYFLICMGIKTPVATLAIIMASLALILLQLKESVKPIIYLIIPATAVFLFISSASVQNGYRYALPVFALGIISGGALIGMLIKSIWGRIFFFLFLGMLLLETGAVRDGYIPFTNLFVRDKKMNWKWLADSNLNWEQNHERLKTYLKQHPEVLYNPNGPQKGLILVNTNDLAGIWTPGKYEWLTSRNKPVGELWQCYILYDTR